MEDLAELLGGSWEIVRDLVFFEYGTCVTCQPFEGGEAVWLVNHSSVEEATEEIVTLVAREHGIELPDDWSAGLADVIDEAGWLCVGCGAELAASDEIGEYLEDEGADVGGATHLLTQAYWPFLTHYTKSGGAIDARGRLSSIIADARIRASDVFITGRHKVVCLTEASPTEVSELLRVSVAAPNPTWDPGRWTLLGHDKMAWKKEPWGVGIERGEAVRLGARPALHGDESLFAGLPVSERFRFVRFEHSPKFADWTFEREFRFLGDLDLSKADPNKVILVVPNRFEQRRLLARPDVPPWAVVPFDFPFAESSPWPRRTERQLALAARGSR